MKRNFLLGTALALIASGASAEGQLKIYAWGGSIDPELVDAFSNEYDVQVSVDAYTSNEDLLTKLQSGHSGYDIVAPSQHFVKIMIDEGLLKDIDAASLDAASEVEDRWMGQWWDPENRYTIPFAYGTAGFAVNRDLYDGPIDSWSYYFEPAEGLQGKIANLSYPDEVVGAAQLYLGVEFCTEDAAEMKKVYDLLVAQKPHVAAYVSDNIDNRLVTGEVAAHFWWDGEAMKTRVTKGANIEFAMPKEGLVGWLDSLAVPADSENVENAKLFINFMSKPANATAQANFYGHSSPVPPVAEDAKFTEANAPELFPDVPVVFSRACSPAAQDLVTKVWTQLLQ
ncbi:extracellular solute-binding protein [Pseudooceanicola nitratireducens]|uniref:extracellular solute-binding protein n=1 Tax=Pseudooceanicola nitratireducens TaxID=517719 RepID=UPI00310887E4